MGFFTDIFTEVVVGALSNEKTRSELIKGGKNFLSSIFDDDGNGVLDEEELDNYIYAELITVMLYGHIAQLSGVDAEFIEEYTQVMIEQTFVEDASFNTVFCQENDLSTRKLKSMLNDAFDQRDSLKAIATFAEEYEIAEIYFRQAIRAIMFARVDAGKVSLNDECSDAMHELMTVFKISRLEARSIQREYEQEAIDWWKEYS